MFGCCLVFAQEGDVHTISGTITSSQIWSGEYHVSGTVTIDSDSSLTIDEGTSVVFDQDSQLIINGSLQINGSASDNVTFTSSGSYWGINISGGHAAMSYLHISGSSYGINAYNAYLTADHLSMTNGGAGIYAYQSTSTLSYISMSDMQYDAIATNASVVNIDHYYVDTITYGSAVDIYGHSSVTVSDSAIADTGYSGAIGVYDSSLTMLTTSVRYGTGDGLGIYDDSSSPRVSRSSVYISDSSFEGFQGDGIGIYGYPTLDIEYSVIANNVFGIYTSKVSDLITIRDDWWGDASGPYQDVINPDGTGNGISNGLIAFPWLVRDPSLPVYSNVIFVPGIEGSRLYTVSNGQETRLWEPSSDSDVEKLDLKASGDAIGESIDPSIYSKDIIDYVGFFGIGAHIYDSFEKFLDGLVGQGLINGWRPYSYDWRLPVFNSQTVDGLISAIQESAAHSLTGKVSLIAHSNGGLVVKAAIDKMLSMQQSGDTTIDAIDSIIFVAVPQNGTPQSIVSLLHGDGLDILDGLILDKATARTFADSMRSAYGLLPNKSYFSTLKQGEAPVIFDKTMAAKYSLLKGSISDFDQFEEFLSNSDKDRSKAKEEDIDTPSSLSEKLLKASVGDADELANVVIPSSIKVSDIIGFGMPTVNGVSYFLKNVCVSVIPILSFECGTSPVLHRSLLTDEEGDGTVEKRSTLSDGSDLRGNASSSAYFFDLHQYNDSLSLFSTNASHMNILNVPYVETMIENLLSADSASTTLPLFFSSEGESDSHSSLRVSVHSPVSLSAYDAYGRRTGVIASNGMSVIQEGIPNSRYIDEGDDKQIILGDGTLYYDIAIDGTGFGLATIDVAIEHGGIVSTSTSFIDVPVTPFSQMRIEIKASPDSSREYRIDRIGNLHEDADLDKQEDFTVYPSGGFDADLYVRSLSKMLAMFCDNAGPITADRQRLDAIAASLEVARIQDTSYANRLSKKIQRAIIIGPMDMNLLLVKAHQKQIEALVESFLDAVGG
jgi:Lecithin:cholesterol acyltransferase